MHTGKREKVNGFVAVPLYTVSKTRRSREKGKEKKIFAAASNFLFSILASPTPSLFCEKGKVRVVGGRGRLKVKPV